MQPIQFNIYLGGWNEKHSPQIPILSAYDFHVFRLNHRENANNLIRHNGVNVEIDDK